MGKNVIRADRGMKIRCKGWEQEAALRMLMNCLDPEVAENPGELTAYMGGKVARTWRDYEATVEALKTLGNDESLMIQSGKPVGIFKTNEKAPRVLMACSFIVPEHATHETFRELLDKGLSMQGGLTAASWFYIGSQGIIGTTFHTLGAVIEKSLHKKSLEGKLVLTSGLGGAGRNQPLAVTMHKGVAIVVEVDKNKIERSIQLKFLDTWTNSLEEALVVAKKALSDKESLSIGLLGNAAEVYSEFVTRNIVPDVITDMTAAHDELNGYIPMGIVFKEAEQLRKTDPKQYIKRSYDSMVKHVQAMIALQKNGAVTFEFGNWIRSQAQKGGLKDAYQFPGFVDEYIRPLFCKGRGGFRYIALSGDPEDIYRMDEAVIDLFPQNKDWIKTAQKHVPFQGLPARICWLGHGERTKAGLYFNELIKKGELKAPVVMAKCLVDAGSLASPDTQTGNMKDGSDVVGDWPILKGMLNVASGASWVSMISEPEHFATGMAVVADGTKKAEEKLNNSLTGDTGLGVIELADAGYEEAIETVKDTNIKALWVMDRGK